MTADLSDETRLNHNAEMMKKEIARHRQPESTF
jgi:hypothetical protein